MNEKDSMFAQQQIDELNQTVEELNQTVEELNQTVEELKGQLRHAIERTELIQSELGRQGIHVKFY